MALRGFLLSKEVQQCSPRTLEYYDDRLIRFLTFLKRISDTDIRSVKRQHVELYFLEMQKAGRRPHTILSSYAALKAFFRWCIAEEYLVASPLRNIRTPKVPKKGKPFLPGDVRATLLPLCPLRLFSGARNAAVLEILWSTGMRKSECANLKTVDLDWTRNRIRVFGKGAKERYVPFMSEAKRAIHRYLSYRNDAHPELWLTEERTPITLQGFTQIMRRMFERAEMHVKDHYHIFRRTWAMRQLRAGIPIKQVQLVGGWESISVLEQYVRAMESEDAMSAKWA